MEHRTCSPPAFGRPHQLLYGGNTRPNLAQQANLPLEMLERKSYFRFSAYLPPGLVQPWEAVDLLGLSPSRVLAVQ